MTFRLVNRTWSGGGIDPASYSQHFNAAWQLIEQDRFADTTGTNLIAKSLFTYDPAARVQTLNHQDALGHVLANYQYSYDAAGQLTQEIHHGITFNYQYDKGGQLTTTTRSDQPAPVVQSFDANGNRTDSGVVVGADNRVLSDADFTYQYDNEGNLIQKVSKSTGDITTYTYDFRNRLTDVTTKSAGGIILESEQYTYDVFDRRIAVTVNGQTLYTVYNGDNAWADYNADGSVSTRYLFGDNTDEIIARWQPGSGTAWYLTDQFGSIRDIINAAGQLIDHIDYSPFGAVLSETNPANGDRFKFTGREYSAGTGLYYFRGRYFDPIQQRFLNEDPLGFFAGDPNLYRYIGNQPTAGTDPYGSDALVERSVEYAANLATSAAEAAVAAAIEGTFNLLEAWAQDRLTLAAIQAAAQQVQQAALDTLWNGLGIPAIQGAWNVLNGPWQSAAYREELFQKISSTVVNSAFGLIMGPLGGALMTVAAPDLVQTQVYFNGIGAYEALQYYRETGDRRLFLVRAIRAGYNIALTVLQWRLNLSPTCNCLGHCFPAGTLVATESGQRPIETIQANDRVWAMDLKDGQWKLRHVLRTFDRVNNDELLSIKSGGEKIQVTPGHPFWVVKGEALELRPWPDEEVERVAGAALVGRWVSAGDLRIGDVLYLKSGEMVAIEEIVVGASGQRVYNLQVEELQCYAIAADCVLVHNSSPGKKDPAATRPKLRKATKEAAQARSKKNANGDFIDPHTGEVVPKEGPFDYGHPCGQEWWRTRDRARKEKWSRKKVIEVENKKKFVIEDPSSNRSHKYEKP